MIEEEVVWWESKKELWTSQILTFWKKENKDCTLSKLMYLDEIMKMITSLLPLISRNIFDRIPRQIWYESGFICTYDFIRKYLYFLSIVHYIYICNIYTLS